MVIVYFRVHKHCNFLTNPYRRVYMCYSSICVQVLVWSTSQLQSGRNVEWSQFLALFPSCISHFVYKVLLCVKSVSVMHQVGRLLPGCDSLFVSVCYPPRRMELTHCHWHHSSTITALVLLHPGGEPGCAVWWI